jgi:hypothetical protein
MSFSGYVPPSSVILGVHVRPIEACIITKLVLLCGDLCPQESYSNPWGFMRKGKLLEDLDACAGADHPRFIQPCFVVQRQTSFGTHASC